MGTVRNMLFIMCDQLRADYVSCNAIRPCTRRISTPWLLGVSISPAPITITVESYADRRHVLHDLERRRSFTTAPDGRPVCSQSVRPLVRMSVSEYRIVRCWLPSVQMVDALTTDSRRSGYGPWATTWSCPDLAQSAMPSSERDTAPRSCLARRHGHTLRLHCVAQESMRLVRTPGTRRRAHEVAGRFEPTNGGADLAGGRYA